MSENRQNIIQEENLLLSHLVFNIKKDITELFKVKITKKEDKLINRLFEALNEGDTCLALNENESLKKKICPVLKNTEEIGEYFNNPTDKPFCIVEDNNKRFLYLHRQLSETVAINQKLSQLSLYNEQTIINVNPAFLKKAFTDLPGKINELHIQQKLACLLSLYSPFTVISGGPGTGKTSVVATLLRILIESDYCGASEIKLCAPTGKAARRLSESITEYYEEIKQTGIIDSLDKTRTIHRLLSYSRNRQSFSKNAENPLSGKVLIVDEVSMIDLSLLKSLFEAVPSGMRVIMLGDPGQLPPVDKGDTLSDIVPEQGMVNYSEGFVNFLKKYKDHLDSSVIKTLPVTEDKTEKSKVHTDSAVVLTQSHRSHGQLYQAAVQIKDATEKTVLKKVLAHFKSIKDINDKTFEDGVYFLETDEADKKVEAAYRFIEIYQKKQKFEKKELHEKYSIFENCKILTFLKKGPDGSEEHNRHITAGFKAKNPENLTEPVMVRINDYRLDIFNGDTGIIDSNKLAYFRRSDLSFQEFPAGSIKSLEKAYAITVHKSQGSEYDHVLIILPDDDNRMLNNQILFTALTRAKKSAVICGSAKAFETAVQNKTRRETGIGLRF